MAWIREIEENEATGELAKMYGKLLESRGKVANILKVHSLDPGALETHLNLYMHIMFSKTPLNRREREAIAVAVSAENKCDYCVAHHLEALQRYERDEAKQQAIIKGEHDVLDGRLASMLTYARRLTASPHTSREEYLQSMRDTGLTDEDILRTTLVTAYFNFVNRIALGLGVAFSTEEVEGYNF